MSLKETLEDHNDRLATKNKEMEFQNKKYHLGGMTNDYIPAYIISDINNSESTAGARKVVQSIRDTGSRLIPMIVPATTPETLKNDLASLGFKKEHWTYPRKGEKRIDFKTGLHITGYGANDIEKVISCMVSHMRCWTISMSTAFPCIVLEHDALFVNKFDIYKNKEKLNKDIHNKWAILNSYGIVGLNNPKGATRKSAIYYDKVLKESEISETFFSGHKLVDAPWVDENKDEPQGLAGNSAYFISNTIARRLMDKIREIGLWPNDALMCKQLFPKQIKQIYPFITELQGIKSTTQG